MAGVLESDLPLRNMNQGPTGRADRDSLTCPPTLPRLVVPGAAHYIPPARRDR